ncbi:hypothetical protein ACJIZ3_018579 [Penstemon smallii]|uniref:Calmodulin-binding domain-containing protein n=1 Tax=Penstemon smallii TaxID=265156 RepID=A0ABD3T075_9LAMI
MVQRKLINKLSIKPDHIKIERLPENLKPSSLQHQDVKNGGADLKKKMKKSGSIKRSEFDSPRSPNLRRHVKQPGKPPPPALALPTSDTTPHKQMPSGQMITKPNYMKSTTSSDARKEKIQVSTKSPQASPDSSSLIRKSSNFSKLSLPSGNKATKSTARTSSLKMMRTPSFKPARNIAKKCSPVALCEDLDVQKATCSSTLKDCKFPAYLTLSPGGTESEGTSAMKVCPYTYCSLNGHHHAPLPPLKCFLSARRRVLKTQRSIKLGCLSPRRARPIGDGLNFDVKLAKSHDLDSSGTSLPTQEEQSDFFVEIYGANKEDGLDLITVQDIDEIGIDQEKQDQSFDKNGDLNLADTAAATHFHDENQQVKVVEEVSPQSLAQEETKFGFLSDITVESNMVSVQFNEQDCEASDIDWDIGHHSALYLDDDYDYPSKTEKDPDLKVKSGIVEDEFIEDLDNNINGWFNEFLADEMSQESFDEDDLSADTWSTSDNCDSIGSYDYYLESLNNVEASAPTVVQVEEPEAAPIDMNDILFQGDHREIGNMVEDKMSFDYLEDFYLPKDDEIANMGNEASDLLKGYVDEMGTCDIGKAMSPNITYNVVRNQTSGDHVCQVDAEGHLFNEYQNSPTDETFKTSSPVCPVRESNSKVPGLNFAEAECHIVHEVKTENAAKLETEDDSLSRATAKCKKPTEDLDELGCFNPRAPNFLPLEPEPDSEKVDLRHQDLDERKNAEEWMVDYALRQTVTKLGPARKRKVALLVEAFEKVMPITKYDINLRHSSALKNARPMQACS